MSSYIYYIGHSTVFIELGGRSFLTDPLLTQTVSFLRRRDRVPPLPDFEDERWAPTVLLSHAHRDHLHLRSLRKVGIDTSIFAPEHAVDLLRKKGFAYSEEASPGDSFSVGGISLEVVSADHQGRRNGGEKEGEDSSVGYVLDDGDTRIYFAGDTDLLPDARNDVGQIDIALLPISGWGPTLGEGHLGPQTAAEQTAILDPRVVIPIHYGPFAPIFFPQSMLVSSGADDDFFRELYKRGIDQKLLLVEPGQFYNFAP